MSGTSGEGQIRWYRSLGVYQAGALVLTAALLDIAVVAWFDSKPDLRGSPWTSDEAETGLFPITHGASIDLCDADEGGIRFSTLPSTLAMDGLLPWDCGYD
jgi:hypothetical protein